MPAPLAISRDAAKTLALEIGMRPASRKLGIPLGTLSAWSTRDPDGPWFRPRPLPLTQQPQTVQTTAANAYQSELSERKSKYRSGMSKYVVDASKLLEQSGGNLKLSRPAKDIADIAGKVWPEQPGQTSGININVLAGSAAFYTE